VSNDTGFALVDGKQEEDVSTWIRESSYLDTLPRERLVNLLRTHQSDPEKAARCPICREILRRHKILSEEIEG
jgi:hypothetical protein